MKHLFSIEVRDPLSLLAVALLLALVTACGLFWAYPLSVLDGSHPYWQYPTGDLAALSTGANYFIRGPWGLPLFRVPALGLPEGASIVFSDSNPFMALLFRLIYRAGGGAHLYFSTWAVLAALLQAPAFMLALYAAGLRNALLLLLGGLTALFAPVWWQAFNHLNLFGHFPLLLALALYLGAPRTRRLGWLFAGFALLLALATLIHAYLFVMVAMLLGASLLSLLWTGRLSALTAFGWAAAALAPTVLVMLVGGHLGSPLIPRNYGLYSLNLLGFVTPQMSGLAPGFEDHLVDATGGQSQGFAWLGAGGLAAVLVALGLGRSGLADSIARDPTRLVSALLILLLALSYAVYAGPYLVAGLPYQAVREAFLGSLAGGPGMLEALRAGLGPLDWLRLALLATAWTALLAWFLWLALDRGRHQLLLFLGIVLVGLAAVLAAAPTSLAYAVATFQASGRFALILVYLVLVLSIATLACRLATSTAAGLLLALLVLQALDSGPLQQRLRAEIASGEAERYPDLEVVEAAFAGADPLVISPGYLCANIEQEDPEARQAAVRRLRRLLFLASRDATPVTTAVHVRLTTHEGLTDMPDCDAERRAAVEGRWGEKAVYLFLAGATPAPVVHALQTEPGRCRAVEDGLLCRAPSTE